MTNSYNFLVKLVEGDNVDITELTLNDLNFEYSIQCIIFLGDYDVNSTVEVDGIDLVFGGGFVYNQTPPITINVKDSEFGILIIGKKTKKQIFSSGYLSDDTINNYVENGYVENYFQLNKLK